MTIDLRLRLKYKKDKSYTRVYLSKSLIKRLIDYCEKHNFYRSEVIQEILIDGLDKLDAKESRSEK